MEDLEELSALIEDLTGAIGGLANPIEDLVSLLRDVGEAGAAAGDGVKAAGDGAKGATGGMDAASGSMGGLKDAASALSDPIGAVQKGLEGLGPEGAAVAAAIGVMVAAITIAVSKLHEWALAAIEVVEQKEELLATFSALGGGEAAGGKTLAMVEALSTKLPFATSKIAEWAKGLMAAGLQGKDLESAVKAVAAATALMGEQGGHAAEDLIKKLAEGGQGADKMVKAIQAGGGKANKLLAEMGLSTKDLAAAMGMTPEQFSKATLSAEQMRKAIEAALQKKGAGALENMVGDLSTIVMKAKEGFASLFKDLGPSVKPFMAALQSLLGMFNKTGSATSSLRPIVTAVFSTLFGWATQAVNAIKGVVTWLLAGAKGGGVFGGAIAVMKAGWTALLGIWSAVKAALTPIVGVLKAIFSNSLVLSGIKTILGVIVGVIVGIITIFAAWAGIMAVVIGVIASVVGAVWGAAAAIWGAITEAVSAAIDALSGLGSGAADAASNFIAGLVGGIASGAGAVIAAVQGLASSVLSGFTGALGIHSPSTIMLEHGEENIAGATAQGMNKGSAKVEQSAQGMAKAAVPKGKPGKGKPGEGGGITISFGDGCQFFGISEDRVRQIFAMIAEEMAGESGAAPEPANG